MASKPNTFLLLGLVAFITIAGTTISANVAFGQFGGFPFLPTEEKVLPTYVVRIPPGAAQQSSPQHYYPPNIAIPAGTTIGWVNDDPGQPHTVTSLPTGSLFNSGIIPYGAFFQRTFDQAGEYTYHCEIHPWRTGKVSVSDTIEKGNNFELTSGTGLVLSLSKNDRTLLNVHPTTITADETTPMTYNIAISDENTNQTVFSGSFFALGNDLQLELISAPLTTTNINTTTTANATTTNTTNTTTVYGPDFSDPITGAYHVQGGFLKPNTDYNIAVEITAIGSQIPENPIKDTFNLKVMS